MYFLSRQYTLFPFCFFPFLKALSLFSLSSQVYENKCLCCLRKKKLNYSASDACIYCILQDLSYIFNHVYYMCKAFCLLLIL